jgi:hypothetical protein
VQNIFRSNFFIKLTHWEYWPFGIIQAPIFLMWAWYALKERSLFYFSASNPSILTGGMMGESKYDILRRIPDSVKPKTVLVKLPTTLNEIIQFIKQHNLSFPLVFKPDLGERGWMVRRIYNEADVEKYLSEIKIDFLIQEFIDLPLEFGVFYIRFPSQANGFVNSITGKEFLAITGDGNKTIQELILEKDRAKIHWTTLKQKYADRLTEILPTSERLELVSIGNHCLGTMFLNKNQLITPKLIATFDTISKQIDGFYFGRFDIRCKSVEELENGNIKIMELNGCGAEPSHIYQPGSSLIVGIKALMGYWQNMYRVSRENHERGVPYLSFREGKKIYKQFKALKGDKV